MKNLTALKILLAAAGVVVFGYGVSQDSQTARLAGIAIVAVGFVLRFVGPREPR